MQDYEWAGLQRKLSWRVARRVIVPDAIPLERLVAAGAAERKLFRYPGLKEDYYLAGFEPDPAVLSELGVDAAGETVLVVVRPPPETSAYHAENPLYDEVIDRIASESGVVAVVIPRTDGQAAALRARGEQSLIVPDRAIDAQSLIGLADLVVSAGGTMNREAVALGTPVYTIFSGAMGAVDERLIADGRLRELDAAGDLDLRKREAPRGVRERRDPALLVGAVLGAVENPALMFVDGRPEDVYALLAFVVAGVLAWVLVPVAERIAWRVGAIDHPNERSLHRDPTPKLGGLAIFVGVSVSVVLFLPWAEQTRRCSAAPS